MKQRYKLNIHYQTYDGYMGFDDWDDNYAEEIFESSLLGDALTKAIIDFAKSKYKHFVAIKSITCLGPVEKKPTTVVGEAEITKQPAKLKFRCNKCETEFNVPKYKCEYIQTGMNEFEYTYSCPVCHERCYSCGTLEPEE